MVKKILVIPEQRVEPLVTRIEFRIGRQQIKDKKLGLLTIERASAQVELNIGKSNEPGALLLDEILTNEQLAAWEDIQATLQAAEVKRRGFELEDSEE